MHLRWTWLPLTVLLSGVFAVTHASKPASDDDPKLVLTPDVLRRSGDRFAVDWSTIPHAFGDWIGIYGARGGELLTRQERKIAGQTGNTYSLVNLRHGGALVRYHRAGGRAVVDATIAFTLGDAEPTQLHTALTEVAGELRVMWVTDGNASPVVSYSTTPTASDLTARGTSLTYEEGDLCELPAFRWQNPGWTHDVLLQGLAPSTTYYFRIGNQGQDILWSPQVYNYTTPPADPRSPVDFIVLGDMGNEVPFCSECDSLVGPEHHDYWYQCGDYAMASRGVVSGMVRHLQASPPGRYRFVAHIGDLSYACGYEAKWDYWMDDLRDPLTLIPYMVSIGNHEYDYTDLAGVPRDPSGAPAPYRPSWGISVYGRDSQGECGVPVAKRWHMPDNGNGVFWFSHDAGLAYIVYISLEHSLEVGSSQRTWLEAELAAVDRFRTPWLFVTSHRPLYCSEDFKGDFQNGIEIGKVVEPTLVKYNVDMFFGAHYHAYERTCPMINQTCRGTNEAPKGIVHIVIGTAGIEMDDPAYLDVDWSEKHLGTTYGFGTVRVENATALLWQYIETSHGRNEVVDSVWLTSDHNWGSSSVAIEPRPVVHESGVLHRYSKRRTEIALNSNFTLRSQPPR